jgi:hypothetical protein
MARKNRAGH